MEGMKDKNMDKDQMKKTHDETMMKIEKVLNWFINLKFENEERKT